MAAGVAASGAAQLLQSSECSQWRAALDRYEEVVSRVTSQKKRARGESLTDLDNWSEI